MALFISTILGTLTVICVTVIATMGITLIFKTSTTTNFAQGAIAAFGCYVVADLLNKYNVNFYVAILVGLIVGILIGLFIDVAIFRTGRYVNAVSKQIITMGIVSLIFGVIPLIFCFFESIPFEKFAMGNFIIQTASGEIVISKHALVCVAITIVVITALFLMLKYSKWGLSVRAVASNEFTAEFMGINTHKVTAVTWSISASLAVLAAVMFAGSGMAISAAFMTTIQINAFLAGILGGFATFYGPIVGAILIPLVNNIIGYFAIYIPDLSRWSMVIVYVLLLIVILIKPQGLFGKKVIKKV